jgi:hypothetical protein
MKATKSGFFVMTGIFILLLSDQIIQANPLAKFIGEYLLGRALDYVWDKQTGKPDIMELNNRLKSLEEALGQTHPNLTGPIRDLRKSVTSNTGEEDYKHMAQEVYNTLSKRIVDLERRADITNRDIEELKKRVSILESRINRYSTANQEWKQQNQQARLATERQREQVKYASNSGTFDGVWFSKKYRYGFRIEGDIGIATQSNSSQFAPGDVILRIEPLSETAFRGEHIFTNGLWQPVSGQLVNVRTIKMQGGGFIWHMSREKDKTGMVCSAKSASGSMWGLAYGPRLGQCKRALKFCSTYGATDCVVAFEGSYWLDQSNTVTVQCPQLSQDFTGIGQQPIQEAFDFTVKSKWYGCVFRVKY